MQPVGFVLTFMCVVASMVVFRSSPLKSASCLFESMLLLSSSTPRTVASSVARTSARVEAEPNWNGSLAWAVVVAVVGAIAVPNEQ